METPATGLIPRMTAVCGAANVVTDPLELRTYECDGLTSHRATPALVVLPGTAEEVAAVVRACAQSNVPFVARGSGTGLSGGAVPHSEGVLIVLSRMRKILEIDPVARRAVLEPGVTNLAVTTAAAPHGLFYAPDPSSQVICSVGGNVAENSGGAHCLKNGFTVHHVTGAEIVTPDGELTWLGDGTGVGAGYDLLGTFTGSEGTLGIVTKIVVKLLPVPETVHLVLAAYDTLADGGRAVSDIIGAGIVPAAIEMMDALAIEAAEAAVACGYPEGAGAVLLVELDGPSEEVEAELATVRRICSDAGARELVMADDPAARAGIWKGRKAAFAAVGRLSPSYIVQDGVVPRTALGDVLGRISDMSRETGIRVANVFHAGDGNLHPLVLYNDASSSETEAAEELSGKILDACIEYGGSITGEHGVGVDKSRYMPKMFTDEDLDTMQLVRCAFDPASLCNPGKVFPTPRLCGEVPGPRRAPHPAVAAGQAEIFLSERIMVTPDSKTLLKSLSEACPSVREGSPADSVSGVTPGFVAAPGSTDEAAALMKAAAARGLTVVPRGGGSRLGWGTPVSRCDLLVDMAVSPGTGVIEHAAGDLVARVRAGARMGSVAAALAEAGQEIALDVPADATAGGVIASGLAGPRRLRYGSPRDLLIGVTVVRADGTVAHSGGKVVKNVAGYDLGKLFAGSAGTLGLITEAVFRLHPLPAARSFVTASYTSVSAASRAIADAAGSPLTASAVELRRGPAPGGPVEVGVLLEGSSDGVSGRASRMAETLGADAGVSAAAPGWWLAGKRVPDGGTLIQVAFWVSALEPVLDTIDAAARSGSLTPVVTGSAGAGVVHVGLGPSADPSAAGQFVGALRAALSHERGSVVVLTAPEGVRAALDDHGGMTGPVPSLRLMKAVRDQFDPEGRMSPGKFPGGA